MSTPAARRQDASEEGMLGRALPRLHVVTDDRVLSEAGWTERATGLLERCGAAVALHVRGPHTSGARLFALTSLLRAPAARAGGLLIVNDRVDVALAAGVRAVQLGGRSLAPSAARRVMGPTALLGSSVHSAGEVRSAADQWTDYLLLGTIFPTPSHPGLPGIGVSGLHEAVQAAPRLPIVAIGGIGVEHVGDVLGTGAHGVAVLRGVWDRPDAAAAGMEYVSAIEEAER